MGLSLIRVGIGVGFAVIGALTLPAPQSGARTLPRIDAFGAVPVPASSDDVLPLAKRKPVIAGVLSVEPRLGVPTFLRGAGSGEPLPSFGAAPSPKSSLAVDAIARSRVADLADLYRISVDEVDALLVQDVQRLPDGGAIVRFANRIDGIDVFREHANVLLDRQGALVAIGGYVTGAPATHRVKARADPPDPRQAIAAALADYKFPPSIAERLQPRGESGGYAYFALPNDALSDDGSALTEAARAKPVWFRTGAGLVAAHYVETQVRDGNGPWSLDSHAYVIAQTDGTLLYRHNQTADAAFTYRVFAEASGSNLPLPSPVGRNGFPHPTGTPDGYQAAYVPANLVTLQNAPFSRNDPWLEAGATMTAGNNVEAFANLAAPDNFGPADPNECSLARSVTGDLHACVNRAATFDYAYDPTQAPNASRAQIMAAVTNLFYMNNYLHDWYYDAGFDEAAGNAQRDNYGRGGIGNDSIYAEAQDYSGIDNANMTTPADGQRPRMRMYVWTESAALSKVNAPAALAGVREAGTADFGAVAFDFSGDLAVALDEADVEGPTMTDGCTPFTNAAAVSGRIAVIDRGTCLFVVKAKNAQNAGAAGVLIVNNVAGLVSMAGDDATIALPVLSVSLADGAAIKAELGSGNRVNMRMARKNAVAREGSVDNTLIAHEWGHYISNRLVANANGLTTQQAQGLGEGFADFHAMLLLVKDGDRSLPNNVGFSGAYTSTAYPMSGPDFAPDVLNNAWYYGTRRYPYSRDMSRNPLTFRHIGDGVALPAAAWRSPTNGGNGNAEVHNTGEVWGSMLWECYSNLLNDTGRLGFVQAQERMKRYLVGGYKMMPANPTFIEARDAILAVMEAQDPLDHKLCLHGFAKRGAGVGAVPPARYSEDNAGVGESYMTVLPADGTRRPVIEYYHAGFDHYFVTDIPDEIAKLDDGTFAGWSRTGESWNAYADTPVGSAAVCRFFSTAFGLRSSHFYTSDVGECERVRQNADWQFEGQVFGVLAPGPSGNCPTGTQPVYRVYNDGQGSAPNHRYTTSSATRGAMLAKGWIAEGYGAAGVIMCAPL